MSMGLLSLSVLNSGCSDSADADDIARGGMCTPGDVLLSPTPEAPAAACSVPPSPFSSLIEAGGTARAATTEQRRAELLDPSRITVVTCGTGSPFPSERAQSCLAVFVNGKFLLFDAGDRAQNSIENLNLPVTDIESIFLTHFHSDHIADLGEVISRSWILGRTRPIEIYGGPEVEQVVNGFNLVYSADEAYRIAHHGEGVFPEPLAAAAVPIERPGPEGKVVYESDGVRVLAYSVDHSPIGTALGYRVEYAGKAVAVSGDTVDTPGLRALAANADVFVSEVMNKSAVEDMECAFGRITDVRLEKIFADIRSYHIDLPELARLANDADVTTLVITHLVPTPLNAAQGDVFFTQPASTIFGGTLVLAEDGTEVVILL
ncbi:MAG: MBL fold metallo-hydrolase [Gammaproteobacteria bacterium]|nr:MBL fold metallo-hydrolase [Gammaproteobacteria bacterium]